MSDPTRTVYLLEIRYRSNRRETYSRDTLEQIEQLKTQFEKTGYANGWKLKSVGEITTREISIYSV